MGKELLVIEEDDDLREMMVTALKDEGYTVVAADNELIALDLLKEGRMVEAILLDLPAMSNLRLREIIDCLTQDKIASAIPVIVMSGDYRVLGNKDLKGFARAILSKPFDLDDLFKRVNEISD